MYLITKWFGTFLCDEKGITKKILFPKDVKEIARRLQDIEKNKILDEEKKLTKGVDVTVLEKRLRQIGDFDPENTFFKNIEITHNKFGFTTDLLHKSSILLTTQKVEEKLGSEDLQIIQMVNALDDLIQTYNLLSERLERWSLLPKTSKRIQPLEHAYSVIATEMKHLEQQIESDMQTIAPNTSKMVGPLISARLISLAGGMERLAILPASTIQVLGAEKALFRFKKEGGKPPKHGVIFQHPLINKSPRTMRGKIARILAAKIAIAAKADVFTKRDVSATLKEDMKKRVQKIRNP
jgi:nucleolar protein 56